MKRIRVSTKIVTAFAAISLPLALVLFSCEKDPEDTTLTPKQINLTAHAPEVITGSNEFGIELFTKVATSDEQNLMLSPLSASAALTMVLNGAGGDTYSQLQGTLKYPEELSISDINEAYKSLVTQLLAADPKVNIAIANALFYRWGFAIKEPFLDVMSTDFGAHIEGLDFSDPSALETINDWASDNTNGKIPEVLNEISPDAAMFIMNALYFKGTWSYQFDKELTEDKEFYLDDGSSINVSTMTGELPAKKLYYDNFWVIELPYGRTNFVMDIILPINTLAELTGTLNYDIWNEVTTSLEEQIEGVETIVVMPKFKFSYEKYLKQQLQSMGMIDAFTPWVANFSNITDEPIYVSFVKQNTFVEVNEEGTEAAAVTTVGFNYTSVGPEMFVVQKPFIFAIRERTTNTLLFIGKVENPNQ
ncbi:MAG TPA: serpin family protein [Tenuifilaceae bacterium]|nr:serpin family protein [Tenuifilaceae bacterium]